MLVTPIVVDKRPQVCEICLGRCVWSISNNESDRCIAPATKYDYLCDTHRERRSRVLHLKHAMERIYETYTYNRRTGTAKPARKIDKEHYVFDCAVEYGRAEPHLTAKDIVATAIAMNESDERPLSVSKVTKMARERGMRGSTPYSAVVQDAHYAEMQPWRTFSPREKTASPSSEPVVA